MLVLTRRAGRGNLSSVVIGENIFLEVIDTRSGEVRLGITAPPAVLVRSSDRQELRQEKKRTR